MAQQQYDGDLSENVPNQAPSENAVSPTDVQQALEQERRKYKGLQGVLQKRNNELTALQQQFDQLSQELEEFRTGKNSVELTLKQQETQWQKQFSEMEQRLQERETNLSKAERERTIQQHLLTQKYAPLIPLYEKKALRAFDDDGKPLEGEALVAFLDSALETVGDAGRYRQIQQQEQQTRDSFGSRSAPSDANPAIEDVEQLGRALTSGQYRFGSPEYEAAMVKYRMLLSQTKLNTGDFLK